MLKYRPFANKFYITGLARSGTTVLMAILARHPEMGRVGWEPFLLRDEFKNQPVEDCYDVLFKKEKVMGIKELCIKHTDAAREYAYKMGMKVIVTHRNNLYKQTISGILSAETKIWQRGQKVAVDYPRLLEEMGPIPIKKVYKRMRYVENQRKILKEEIDQHVGEHFVVDYEDFYFGSRDYQIDKIESILRYIGHAPIVTERMIDMLDHGRLNNDDTYKLIANINEIEKEFAGKYGSLFETYRCPVV